MRNKILFIVALVISFSAKAQVPSTVPQLFGGKYYQFAGYARMDSGILLQARDTSVKLIMPGIIYRSADSSIYFWNMRQWKKITDGATSGGVVGSDPLKLNISDTASMLSPYYRSSNPSGYITSSSISGKVNYTDTASMLSPYLRTQSASASYQPIGNYVPSSRTISINGTTYDLSADRSWTVATGVGSVAWGAITGTLSSQADLQSALNAKLNISDTSSMLSGYQRNGLIGLPTGGTTGQFLSKSGASSYLWSTPSYPPTTIGDVTNLQDSLNGVRNASVPTSRTITINGVSYDLSANRSWTVSTSAGSVEWGAITGTLSTQTDLQSALNAKAPLSHSHQISDVTGLQGQLDGKAATSHVHSISDVTSLSTSLNAKVNVSDTATMLAPYLRSVSAAATYQPIGSYATTTQNNLKLNISDTSSMLSGYQRSGLVGLPAGGTTGQSLFKTGGGYEWATPTYPPTTVADVTNLQDSLNGVRNASVPTARTLTINGTTYDLTANRSWTISGSGGTWGSITGTLSAQTDLQSALDGKQAAGSYAAASHTHVTGDVTGLSTALGLKVNYTDTATMLSGYQRQGLIGLPSGGTTGQALFRTGGGYEWATPTYPPTAIADVTGLQAALDAKAASSHTHAQSDITNLTTDLAGKQATLVSGTNIKTVNGNSLLGSGDISISGTAAWGSVTGTLSSQTDLQSALDGKQATLVSGTNIKTLSGDAITGGGDLNLQTAINTANKVKGYTYFNEFINTIGTSASGADIVAVNNGTGAATSALATDAVNRIGLVRSTTGTTATGRTAPTSAASAIRFGGGAWVYETHVNVTTLSTSTERYQLAIGFIDANNAANQVDGAFFLYDEGGVSTGSTAAAYWQTVTTSNSARTFNTSLTQTTVNAATWVKLRIEVNAAGNSVGFYINNTLVATHTANIPTAAGRETGFGWILIKSVGTTARTVDFDYIGISNIFTTER